MSEDLAVDKSEVAEVPKNNKHNFEFNVDINVINHLGVGLYSSTPAALTELVANAWDADANEVTITISPDSKSIIIEDDGHGMDVQGIKERFLKVGYSRRNTAKGRKSESGQRDVMGRKGIGKLSMFALANNVRVTSQRNSQEIISFEINVPELKRSIESGNSIILNEVVAVPLPKGHGTRIELKDVLSGLNTTEKYLRLKLARRFSVIDPKFNFDIKLNGKSIVKEDRGFYDFIQFLWSFEPDTKRDVEALAKNIAQVEDDDSGVDVSCSVLLPDSIFFDGQEYKINGYIASVAKPKNLGSGEESANVISIFANKRVFAEDVLPEFNSARYYRNYLVGEIHADFLDADGVDRATASREAIKKDDPKFRALISWLGNALDKVGEQWDDWRAKLGVTPDDSSKIAITEWIDSLDEERDKKAAKKLIASVQSAVIHSDEVKNEAAKKILYKGAITAFEKLRIRKELDKLEKVKDVLSPEFALIFSTLSDVEEAAYSEITKQRLEVIKKFKDIAKDPVTLEKVAQKYLFDNLWLLDPSWDRTSGIAEMEKTLTDELKKVDPDSTGARLDITYRRRTGRHIIVELKRPEKNNLRFMDLLDQARKYDMAVDAYYETHYPSDRPPAKDIFLLVSEAPKVFRETDRLMLENANAKIITYEQLINDAYNTYQCYLDTHRRINRIDGILSRI